ncbi:hypothetical protein EDD15DRAFT_2154799 [Pisolithus albus]|nr:hypothetical protein EDD15DRAFT_2154799 [Pisolithus albus]
MNISTESLHRSENNHHVSASLYLRQLANFSLEASISKPDHDSNDTPEEGEEMEVSTADEEAMMAVMGLSGFGSTKGKHVEGNQEGSVNIKKIRTWRQYMNRYSPV